MRSIFIISLLFLSACTTQNSVRIVCPNLIEYTKEDQRNLANELKETSKKEYITLFLRGYSALREQVKTCQN